VFGVGGLFLAVLLALLFLLPGLREMRHDQPPSGEQLRSLTIFFSVFVLMQFWNLFNARCMGTSESALSGLWRNKAFLFIASVIVVGQVLLVQFGGDVFRTVPLSWLDWLVVIVSTSPVLIVGEAMRKRARIAGRGTA
jgi:Ca2+-transporting ATPase